MPNKKYIKVYCGQNIQIKDVMSRDSFTPDDVLDFPEKDSGTESVRGLVRYSVAFAGYLSIITRYSHALYELGSMIDEDLLDVHSVEVHLLRGGDWSVHYFDTEGVLDNNWPFGILD